jgi:hypothetical protein
VAEKLFYRGASVLKLTEALVEAGYNVAIYGSCATKSIDKSQKVHAIQFVEIKSFDAPLDISNLASLVALPAYKRVSFHIGMVEECEKRGLNVDGGLGLPQNQNMLQTGVSMLGLFEDCFIQPNVNSKESAEQWIDEVMSKIEGQ